MDAHALLKSQGWRGHGHTLHPTDDSTGLAKPLLLARKDNTYGIGKKQTCTSDQWWLNAFDQQLQGLDTTSKKGVVTQTVQHGALNTLQTRGAAARYTGAYGLYTSFVSGGLLEGTISRSSSSSAPSAAPSPPPTEGSGDSTPRRESGRAQAESKSERKARRALRRRERAEKKARGGLDIDSILAARKRKKEERKALETKEEKRARREAKRKRKEARRKGTAG